MKEKTDRNEFEHTVNAINHLSDKDAKSLLKIIYGFVQTAMTGNGGDQVKLEVINKLSDIYQQIPELDRESLDIADTVSHVAKNEHRKELLQTTHIVFSYSTAGSLKNAFRHTNFAETEEIIVFPDLLSVGPIKALQTQEGMENRYQWFKKNYRDDFNEMDEYKQGMLQALEKIKKIPAYQKVIIWTCENAAEQTGLRIVLYLLQDNENEIFELNTYKAYQELYPYSISEEEQYPLSSGEVPPEKLLQFYKQAERKSISPAKCKALCHEGEDLLQAANDLRTWECGEVRHARIEEGDGFIIECARKLHKEQGIHDYMKAARLIGEVIGHMQQYVGDGWIDYRLRALISKGIFDYRGGLHAMRFYEVRLKKEMLPDVF
ncbi:DUF1835 domain-containing protein [Pradoshia sp.]